MATVEPGARRTASVYETVGLTPFINASGTVTVLGGTVMPAEVLAAMTEAAHAYVDIPTFHEKGGAYLAELIGVPGAFISSGAAGGVAVAVAAALTGLDAERAYDLPRTADRPNEIVALRAGRPNYLYQAAEMVGGRVVEVGEPRRATVDDFAAAIGPKTAAILYVLPFVEETLAGAGARAATIAAVAEVSRRAGIPLIVDAAAELPPREKLRRFHQEGADLVIFSGGKGIFGPQSSGLVVGRADLIAACRLNGSPSSAVGRGMKVGKEEMAGLIRAVELFLARDEAAVFAEWERQARVVADRLAGIGGIEARVRFPDPRGRPPEAPRCFVTIVDPARGTGRDLAERLAQGTPPIRVRVLPDGIFVEPMTLRPGEEVVVAEQIARALDGG